ncbi:MAG: hypothetical protein HC911_12670 [Chloroflexaceae bacterium]|nr:hypothetical protein [Chloroflexaceae bacterium]
MITVGYPVLSPMLLMDVLSVIRRDPLRQTLVLDDMMYVRLQCWLEALQSLAAEDARAALLWQRFADLPFERHHNDMTGEPEWMLPAEWLQRLKSARYYLSEMV